MIVRYLNENDVSQHDKVTSQAFIYTFNPLDKSELPCEKVLGAFDDDNKTLFADMEVNDKLCFFGNGTLRCAAVEGVASKPEYRKKGAVRKLFENILTDKNYDISILYPFSASYYRQFGYESVGQAMKLTVPFTELKSCEKNTSVNLCEEKNVAELIELYNRFSETYNLSFIRNSKEEFNFKPYETGNYTYIRHNQNGENEAYVSYNVDRENNILCVKEIGFLTPEALKGILGFLRNYEGNQDTIVFEKLPINSPVLNLINDETKVKREVKNVGSARILNVENVLKTKKYPQNHGEFTIKCIDNLISENNTVFKVIYDNGTGIVEKSSDFQPDYILQPEAFSSVLLGGINDNKKMQYIRGLDLIKENPSFCNAFNYQNSYFTDEF